MRVLLVEDDKLIGSGVEDGLIDAGMTVDWAHDGRQAQLALETTPYDLVVLDLGRGLNCWTGSASAATIHRCSS